MENLAPFPFSVQRTLDGSPTLCLSEGEEWMHSRQGAFSETRHVYGQAVAQAFSQSEERTILSIGLGLGYVEMWLAAQATVEDRVDDYALQSFEGDGRLWHYLQQWLVRPESSHSGWAYDWISRRTASAFCLTSADIRRTLNQWMRNGQWRMEGELGPTFSAVRPAALICYDLFSSRTLPSFWSSEFLSGFLEVAAARRCTFSTYASTGTLKRCLGEQGFSLLSRPGFGAKRECTLAFRT